jgi:hypothetical protein
MVNVFTTFPSVEIRVAFKPNHAQSVVGFPVKTIFSFSFAGFG